MAALQVGAPFAAAQAALARFAGVTRRFEFRGEAGGVTFVDDYAHLPAEVRAALATARTGGWARVVAVFQPHRFSRTAALATEFGTAFADADVLVVTDIYSAGERPVPGVSGRLVADAVRAQDPRLPVAYVAGWEELRQAVRPSCGPGDLCLTLGAGDLTDAARRAARVAAVVTFGGGGDGGGEWRALADALGDRATLGEPLGPLTTYGVGGPAALFVEVEGPDDLDVVRLAWRERAGVAAAARRLRARAGLQPVGGRRGIRRGGRASRRRASPASTCRAAEDESPMATAPSSGRAPRWPCRCWPAGPPTRDGAGCRGRSACRARSAARCG